MQLVRKLFKTNEYYNKIIKFIKACHFSLDDDEYVEIWNKFITEYDDEDLPLNDPGRLFCTWIIDRYNATLKRTLTERNLFTIPKFLDKLFRHIVHDLADPLSTEFSFRTNIPSTRTINSAKKQLDARLIQIFANNDLPNHYFCRQLMNVQQELEQPDRVYDYYDDNNDVVERTHVDTIIYQNAYIERKGLPETGWSVNLDNDSCECLIYMKDGSCVHVCAAKMRIGQAFPGCKNTTRRSMVSQRGRHVNVLIPTIIGKKGTARSRGIGRPIRGSGAIRGRLPLEFQFT
ncbi:hypothetical protein BC833DRAFT_584340 [Globomyces pollinis-pini]|nr:hypothetical protein BC833DRAFT_584340 [Globomyces pollinis-pini]